MIDNGTKEQIKEHLIKYCENAGSANKAAERLKISGATISNIIANKWDSIGEGMWRKLSAGLNFNLTSVWMHADTEPYKNITDMFMNAKQYATVYGIACRPGAGKTYSLDRFRTSYPNVWYVKCKRHTSETILLQEILKSAGRASNSRRIDDLLTKLEMLVARTPAPLIIIDEIEVVKNDALFVFKDLYNLIEDKCGIVCIGTNNLINRIDKGLKNEYNGFDTLYSRLGSCIVEIPAPSRKDALAVVQANGISEDLSVNTILNDKEVSDGRAFDLRRVKRLIHKERLLSEDTE